MLLHRPAIVTETGRQPVAIRWEESPCTLCGRAEESLLLEAPDPLPSSGGGLWFAVVSCGHCGLAYTNPRPAPESIGQFYPSDYGPHRRPRPMRRLKRWYPLCVLRGRASERRSLSWRISSTIRATDVSR